MSRSRSPAAALRRKAYRCHRKADAALADRRVWDAAQLRTRALDLEARADLLECEGPSPFDGGAGFDDDDLPDLATARPAGLTFTGSH